LLKKNIKKENHKNPRRNNSECLKVSLTDCGVVSLDCDLCNVFDFLLTILCASKNNWVNWI
jgi:hypothetical protein